MQIIGYVRKEILQIEVNKRQFKARQNIRPADQLQYILTMLKLKSEEMTAESRKQKKYDDFIARARAAMIYNQPLSSDRRLTEILS